MEGMKILHSMVETGMKLFVKNLSWFPEQYNVVYGKQTKKRIIMVEKYVAQTFN